MIKKRFIITIKNHPKSTENEKKCRITRNLSVENSQHFYKFNKVNHDLSQLYHITQQMNIQQQDTAEQKIKITFFHSFKFFFFLFYYENL